LFKETYKFIEHFSEFKYANKIEKIENIKKSRHFEEICDKAKEKFDDIVKKIQRQDMAIVESTRSSSIRLSNLSTQNENDFNHKHHLNVFFMNGVDYLDTDIDEREKQIKIIAK
jgi:phosphoenolpyruvate carboxylase